MAAIRFSAQPGGVEVAVGEAEIVVSFPDADSYFGPAQPQTVRVDLDSATARHLARELLAVTPTEEQEVLDAVQSAPVTLPRTGGPSLRFRGRIVADADGERFAGRDQNRWWELAVYRTDRGRYIATRSFRTRWQGETGTDEAEPLATAAAVAAWYRDYSPMSAVRGYPPGEAYAARQAQLQDDLRRQYESLVGTLLAGDEFAEDVNTPLAHPDDQKGGAA